jgi:hypothetical protein
MQEKSYERLKNITQPDKALPHRDDNYLYYNINLVGIIIALAQIDTELSKT